MLLLLLLEGGASGRKERESYVSESSKAVYQLIFFGTFSKEMCGVRSPKELVGSLKVHQPRCSIPQSYVLCKHMITSNLNWSKRACLASRDH